MASAQTSNLAPRQQLLRNCPAGLESLTEVNQLFVYQQISRVSGSGVPTNNLYIVKNAAGQLMYFATEENSACNRLCCGPARSFTMRVMDRSKHEVITLQRPLACDSCCCPCCPQEIEVQTPQGSPIGYVTQDWSLWEPEFTILDGGRQPVLKIVGQCCVGWCDPQVYFMIETLGTSSVIGAISKQPIAAILERSGGVDNYGIEFPVDLDVKIKATLFGACILIDFMYFEKKPCRVP